MTIRDFKVLDPIAVDVPQSCACGGTAQGFFENDDDPVMIRCQRCRVAVFAESGTVSSVAFRWAELQWTLRGAKWKP